MKEIECFVNQEDILTLGDNDLDVKQSEKKFILLLTETLKEQFPGSKIYITVGARKITMIDGLISHPAISHINNIIEKVLRDKEWVIKKFRFIRPELLN